MYAVIENTPGYLPDNDDPPTFDEYAEALNYLVSYRRELLEGDWGVDEDGNFMLDVGEIEDGSFVYYDLRKIHDLGRWVEIVPVEGEDDVVSSL